MQLSSAASESQTNRTEIGTTSKSKSEPHLERSHIVFVEFLGIRIDVAASMRARNIGYYSIIFLCHFQSCQQKPQY